MAMYLHRQILFFALLSSVFAFPEQGIFQFNLTKVQPTFHIAKSLFNGTDISMKVECFAAKSTNVTFTWILRETNCLTDLFALTDPKVLFSDPAYDIQGLNLYNSVSYKIQTETITCSDAEGIIHLKDVSEEAPETKKIRMDINPSISSGISKGNITTIKPVAQRKKRAANADVKPGKSEKSTVSVSPTAKYSDSIYKAWRDGIYIFSVKIENFIDTEVNAEIVVSMKGKHGYLSAIDWPFLPFYAVMCSIYVIYALAWLIMCAMNWRDLLRIQFWISAVILLGLVEKAVYIEDYRSISFSGKSLTGAMYFALFLTSLKRTLARILIVIACLGYGIVKPRLGNQLQRVLALAFLFFCFSYADEVQKGRLHRGYNQGKGDLFTIIPLAVIDALFCWWIFTSLFSTMKTLRIRRNVVKLSLYNHFTNTLVLAVLISIGYMIWSLVEHRFSKCLPGWKGIWIDEAFWHFSFSFVLGIIIVLWRPTINDQRFASTPLLDDVDEEDNETNLNDSFSAKKRTTMISNGPTKKEAKNKKAEEDLKWIDENIPTTVVESSLPNLINDSDEEILNTKFEMSKMD